MSLLPNRQTCSLALQIKGLRMYFCSRVGKLYCTINVTRHFTLIRILSTFLLTARRRGEAKRVAFFANSLSHYQKLRLRSRTIALSITQTNSANLLNTGCSMYYNNLVLSLWGWFDIENLAFFTCGKGKEWPTYISEKDAIF